MFRTSQIRSSCCFATLRFRNKISAQNSHVQPNYAFKQTECRLNSNKAFLSSAFPNRRLWINFFSFKNQLINDEFWNEPYPAYPRVLIIWTTFLFKSNSRPPTYLFFFKKMNCSPRLPHPLHWYFHLPLKQLLAKSTWSAMWFSIPVRWSAFSLHFLDIRRNYLAEVK